MKVINGHSLDFSKALYKAQCNVCEEELEWEANFDADGTTYSAECCLKCYLMSPSTVKISVDDAEEEDEDDEDTQD